MAWASHNSFLGNKEEGREGGIKKKDREKKGILVGGLERRGQRVCVCVCWRGFSYSLCMQIKRLPLSAGISEAKQNFFDLNKVHN